MKQCFHQKKPFPLNSRVMVLQMNTTSMLKQFGRILKTLGTFAYGLDPAWYFVAPGLAWDPTLKITKVQLKLLSDPEMMLMIESGIREGIATISHRHAKANNEYMRIEFDPCYGI